jgi:hypothetical protein
MRTPSDRLRRRLPSPALVLSLVSLFMSAGGTVAAAALITSGEIRDNTIRSVDIRDETVRSRDIDDGSLTGADVKNSSLTGADLEESTLGQVPNTDQLDGLDSTQLLRRGESFTRHFSCAGVAWENGRSTEAHSISGSLKHGQGSVPGPLFYCNVDIPTGATVTAVSFAVKDSNPAGFLTCGMGRTNMTNQIGLITQMAIVDSIGRLGGVRITDTTINQPVIDNANFSYFLTCGVGDDSSTGIYGGIVTYRVNAAAG